MNQGIREEDRVISLELKMSEANFIISALAGVKFRADALMNKIVDQGNPQLPKPTPSKTATAPAAPDVDLPVGISEEVDDAILAVFDPEWKEDQHQIEFDFSRPGHVVVAMKFAGEKADAVVERAEKFVSGLNLQLNVNREIEGATVLLFSWADGVQAYPQKEAAPAVNENENFEAGETPIVDMAAPVKKETDAETAARKAAEKKNKG